MNFNNLKNDYRIYAGILIFVSLIFLAGWTRINSNVETTDNATIQCDVIEVTSQVRGIVQTIHFEDNTDVNLGDTLVQIESELYKARLDKAEAQFKISELAYKSSLKDKLLSEINAKSDYLRSKDNINASFANYESSLHQVKEAQAAYDHAVIEVKLANSNYNRTLKIFKQSMTSEATLESSQTDLELKKSLVNEFKAKLDNLKKKIDVEKANLEQVKKQSSAYAQSEIPIISRAEANSAIAEVQVNVARAERDLAMLDFKRTSIRALRSGIVTNRNISSGQLVEIGQPIASIVTCSETAWVVANYKETQIGNMKPGLPVEISIDAYNGIEFDGEVESISGGSGSTFSLLPPENATGNFTKVVQRIPVRIKIKNPKNKTLRVGMSVVSTVFVN